MKFELLPDQPLGQSSIVDSAVADSEDGNKMPREEALRLLIDRKGKLSGTMRRRLMRGLGVFTPSYSTITCSDQAHGEPKTNRVYRYTSIPENDEEAKPIAAGKVRSLRMLQLITKERQARRKAANLQKWINRGCPQGLISLLTAKMYDWFRVADAMEQERLRRCMPRKQVAS